MPWYSYRMMSSTQLTLPALRHLYPEFTDVRAVGGRLSPNRCDHFHPRITINTLQVKEVFGGV